MLRRAAGNSSRWRLQEIVASDDASILREAYTGKRAAKRTPRRKEKGRPWNQQARPGPEEKGINKQLRAVSRALAKALAEELRQYVYNRAMQKFDDETNVLWRQLANPEQGKSAPGGKSWNALIKDALPPGKAHGMAHKLENTIDRAGRFLGGPVHLERSEAVLAQSSSPIQTATFPR